jgi:voltage-gated potassium channel
VRTSILRDRLAGAALLVVATFAVGILGYRVIAGSEGTWMQAVYMAANVLTTTGFREAVDISKSTLGTSFTIFLMIFGAGVMVYSTSVITAFVVEGDLTQGFRRRRMRRAVEGMSGHFIVCGVGATGWAVVRELVNTEREVVAIETAADKVSKIETDFPNVPVLQEDFTDDQALLRAGVARAYGIVVCTTIDKDLLVTTITARQLNPSIRIVARAANDRAVARLRQAGADSVVSPALIGGMRMASELIRPGVVTFLDTMLRDTNRNLRIEEVTVPLISPMVGRTLGDLNTHSRTNCLLLATKSVGGAFVYNPPDKEAIEAGMVLIVMGDPKDVRTLQEVCGGAPTPATATTA